MQLDFNLYVEFIIQKSNRVLCKGLTYITVFARGGTFYSAFKIQGSRHPYVNLLLTTDRFLLQINRLHTPSRVSHVGLAVGIRENHRRGQHHCRDPENDYKAWGRLRKIVGEAK